jgi:hypothetical protein
MSANELAALVHVQDLDLRADQARHRRSHLPETADRRSLEADLGRVTAEHEQLTERHRAHTRVRDDGEATTVANGRQRQQLDRKLAGASTAREADALTAELAALAARQSTLDDAVLEALVALEELEESLAALVPRRADLEAGLEAARAREAAAVAVVDAELAALARERANALEGVGAELQRRYEALRSRLGGIGLARVVERRCSGCNLLLPSAELEELRRLAAGEAGECSQCGRLLVP